MGIKSLHKKNILLIVGSSIAFILQIESAIGDAFYKCTDKDGHMVFTDTVTDDQCVSLTRPVDEAQDEPLMEEKKSRVRKGKVAVKRGTLKEERKRKSLFNQCIEKVEGKYSEQWNSECRSRGRGDNCYLPLEHANRLDNLRLAEIDQCLRSYPQASLQPP